MKKNLLLVTVLTVLLASSCQAKSPAPEMVLIKGDTYDLKEFLEETGTEVVKVDDLYVQKYETTRKELEAYIEATGKKDLYKINFNYLPYLHAMAHLESAAVGVTFFEVLEYCNWRSVQDGFEPAYKLGGTMSFYVNPLGTRPDVKMPEIELNENANGYRLPTFAEWVYFAFGGVAGMESRWWEKMPIKEYAWVNTSSSSTKEVGQLTPNPFGLYDVFGNAAEWCWDIKPYRKKKDISNPARVVGRISVNYRNFTENEVLKEIAENSEIGEDPLMRFYIGIRMVRNAE